jgi:hypothetical protein
MTAGTFLTSNQGLSLIAHDLASLGYLYRGWGNCLKSRAPQGKVASAAIAERNASTLLKNYPSRKFTLSSSTNLFFNR